MAVKGNTYLTLADVYKRSDKDKMVATIIEMLAETNEILQDMIVDECNNGTKHKTTVRTGLPSATWGRLYKGVQPSKSTTKQVEDTTGYVEALSEVDKKLVELSKRPERLAPVEASAFLEALNQEMAETLFYGDTAVDPDKFMGFAPRFNDLNAESGKQIVDAGGTGSDNTSIYIVVWGKRTVHGLYPENVKAGIDREDYGEESKTMEDSSILRVLREKFTWHNGLSVRDYRYVVRIANIDVSDLSEDGTTGANLFRLMVKAYWKLQQRKVTGGKAAIYANSTILEYLDHQSREANNKVHLRWQEAGPDSEPVLHFRKIPVRECDAILNTEARVV